MAGAKSGGAYTIGKALSLNGTSDYGTSSYLILNAMSLWSISFWINIQSGCASSAIILGGNAAQVNNVDVQISGADYYLRFHISNGNSCRYRWNTTSLMTANTWYHCFLNWDRNAAAGSHMTLRINDVLQTPTVETESGTMPLPIGSSLVIGANYTGTSQFSKIYLNNLMFHNNLLLPDSDNTINYNGGKITPPKANYTVLYPLNEGVGLIGNCGNTALNTTFVSNSWVTI